MHLVACATPTEPLEVAPRSALLADLTEGERWEGFWAADTYFVRCTRASGEVAWYKLADDVSAERRSGNGRTAKDGARVLNFPTNGRLQTRVVIAEAPGGRRMLVGTAHRAGRKNG
jgi:hypothetical protein